MNKSQMAKLAAAAGVNGLMYDPNAEGVFGNVQGYTVTVMPNVNNRVYYMLSLSVSRMGMAPNPADFKPLEKMNKVLSGCTVQRFRVNFLVKLSGNKDKMAEALHSALDTLITFLRTNGYTNCCEHCGRPEGIDAYTVSGNAYLLCEPCFGQVSEAAALLSDTSRVAQLHTSQTYVSVGEAQQYALASETSGLTLAGQYTIKDISGNGISFSGPFTQKMTIYLPVAKDYVLSSESRFSFDIRYSENLDFDRSLVTFYWGTSIPLYSHKLTKEGATGETLTFSVPADAIGEAGSSITVVFDLEIKDLDCTVRSMNTPWAYIAANSSLYLPAGENTTLNLANLPAPFQRASRMNNVVMILSDDATQTELTLAGRIMAMLGAGSTPYGLLKVIRAENFQAAAYGNSNLIVVGLSDRNSVFKQINPYLHFQYTDDMTSLAESTKLVMTADYAHEASVLSLMKSPYNETMALLTASAATEAGLQNLMARLSTEKNRWSLGKEALVVDGYGGASSYQFTVSTALTQNAEKPSFADVIVQNREPMTLLLVGMGCMLVLLLAAVLLLVRIHHRRKYDDK